jgi:hypothetical protein
VSAAQQGRAIHLMVSGTPRTNIHLERYPIRSHRIDASQGFEFQHFLSQNRGPLLRKMLLLKSSGGFL